MQIQKGWGHLHYFSQYHTNNLICSLWSWAYNILIQLEFSHCELPTASDKAWSLLYLPEQTIKPHKSLIAFKCFLFLWPLSQSQFLLGSRCTMLQRGSKQVSERFFWMYRWSENETNLDGWSWSGSAVFDRDVWQQHLNFWVSLWDILFWLLMVWHVDCIKDD